MYFQHPTDCVDSFKVGLSGHAQSKADLPECQGFKLSSKVELHVREANGRAYSSC